MRELVRVWRLKRLHGEQEGGSLNCWGWNDYGQLGDETTTESFSPVRLLRAVNARSTCSAQCLQLTHPQTHTLTHSLSQILINSHTYTRTHSHSHTLTHSHTHTLTHSHIHTLTHSHTHTLSHSHTHTLTLSRTHTLTLKHPHTHILTHAHTHTLTQSHTHTLTHSRVGLSGERDPERDCRGGGCGCPSHVRFAGPRPLPVGV